MQARVVFQALVGLAVAVATQDMSFGDPSYVVRLHGSTAEALRQLNLKLDDGTVTALPGEPMPMTASNGKRYLCYVPAVADETHVDEDDAPQTRLDMHREIAAKARPRCLVYIDVRGKAMYEICHGKSIHRFDVAGERHLPKPETRREIAAYSTDAELLPVETYTRLKPHAQAPLPHLELDDHTVLYTQRYGGDDGPVVQFVCADVAGQSVVGIHKPSPKKDATAFLVGSRSFCLDPHAESAMDLSVAAFLRPLTSTDTCVKRTEGWWTYDVCFGSKISQFHREQTGEITSEFSLGEFNAEANEALGAGRKAILNAFMDGTHEKEQPAFEQIYDHGTPCDAVDKTRSTRLLLFCPPVKTQPPYIISIQETSTCTYTIKVATPSICAHPHFAKEDQRRAELSQTIHCVPSDDDVSEPEADEEHEVVEATVVSPTKDEL